MKNKLMRRAALFLTVMGLSVAASADPIPPDVELRVIPADQTVGLGDLFSIQIVLEPMGNLISGFGFELQFDEAILDLVSVTFGSGFGPGSFQAVTPASGSVTAIEVGLVDDLTLESIQNGLLGSDGTFLLATMQFSAEAIGASMLSMVGAIFGQDDPFNFVTGEFDPELGQFGDTVPLAAIAEDGRVAVEGPQVSVPEPGTAYLLLLGLACLALARRGRAALPAGR